MTIVVRYAQELGSPIDSQSFVQDSSCPAQNKPSTAPYRPSSQLHVNALTSLDDTGNHELEPSDDEYVSTKLETLEETFNEFSVSYRFFGKSSARTSCRPPSISNPDTAAPNQTTCVCAFPGAAPSSGPNAQYVFVLLLSLSCASPLPLLILCGGTGNTTLRLDLPCYTFPEPDMIANPHFLHINLFFPLLHRPTFVRQVSDNLHFRD